MIPARPRLLVLGLLALLAAAPARAQRPLEIHPYLGYQFGGKIGVDLDADTSGDLALADGPNFGIMAGLRVTDGVQLQLLWNRQESRIDFEPQGPGDGVELFDVGIDYFQVAVDYALEVDRLLPFLTLGLGTSHIDPQGVGADSEWRFSMVFGGGARYYLSEGLALRAQLRLYSTFIESRGALFCDGVGECYETNDSGTLIQGELSAGAVLGF